MNAMTNTDLGRIADALRAGQRFVISSHTRPDGDSIGSSVALALALRAIGKTAEVVHADPAPGSLTQFPGVSAIRLATAVDEVVDAAIVLECGELARTGVTGLDRSFVINIDHHPGNSGYGNLQWFDPTAAACGEMIFALVKALDAPLTSEIATHIYLAILTDTGSFHYSGITPRTFQICKEALEAGVDPVLVARDVFDSSSLGRLKIFGAVLNRMQIDPRGRVAIIYLDQEMARSAGGTYDDTEGLINQPLTVKQIEAVVFFRQLEAGHYRVSMRSKGDVDVGAIAKAFGGGGHKNAAGCTIAGAIDTLQPMLVERIERAIDGRALSHR
jgi:phosphoesterase RecJ-like protein